MAIADRDREKKIAIDDQKIADQSCLDKNEAKILKIYEWIWYFDHIRSIFELRDQRKLILLISIFGLSEQNDFILDLCARSQKCNKRWQKEIWVPLGYLNHLLIPGLSLMQKSCENCIFSNPFKPWKQHQTQYYECDYYVIRD